MPGDVAENQLIRSEIRSAAGSDFDRWYRQGRDRSLESVLDEVLAD